MVSLFLPQESIIYYVSYLLFLFFLALSGPMIAAVAIIGSVLTVLVLGVIVFVLRWNNIVMPTTFEPEQEAFKKTLEKGPKQPKENHVVEYGKLITGSFREAHNTDKKMRGFAEAASGATTKTGTNYEGDIQIMRLAAKKYRPSGLTIDTKALEFSNDPDESNWHELQEICKVWSEILKVPAEFGVFANSEEVPEFLNTQALSDISNVLTTTEGTTNMKIVEKTLKDCLGEDEARQMEGRILTSMMETEKLEKQLGEIGLTKSEILAEDIEMSEEEQAMIAELKMKKKKKKKSKKKKSKKGKSQKGDTSNKDSQKKEDTLKEKLPSNKTKSDKESPISGREKSPEEGNNEAKSEKGSPISRKEKSTGQ